MHSFEYKITAAELRNAYIAKKKTIPGRTVYICHLLRDMVSTYSPVSHEVIDELIKAKPERFVKHDAGDSLDNYFKQKYSIVQDPRLSFLNAIPDDYVFTFTFTMYKR